VVCATGDAVVCATGDAVVCATGDACFRAVPVFTEAFTAGVSDPDT
jgi:hypothetical protein